MEESKEMLSAKRLPRDYFVTKGKGESDLSVDAGSFHLALRDAGIEMCNIMTYSSVLPGIAREIEMPKNLVHGSVMESIMSKATCGAGESITAGLILGWLYHKKTGEKLGGIVCKFNDSSGAECIAKLKLSLEELYDNGFSEEYYLRDVQVLSETVSPQKRFGTAIVALCFVNYVYPIQ